MVIECLYYYSCFQFFLVILFEKKIRKYIFSIVTTVFVIFIIAYLSNKQIKINFDHFSRNIDNIVNIFLVDTGIQEQKTFKGEVPLYYQEFRSFYETWKLNKFIGGGSKILQRKL